MNRTTKFAAIGLALLAVVAVGIFVAAKPPQERPEVTLSFADPADPGLMLTNDTGTEARDIVYAFGLWNTDNLGGGDEMLPMRRGRLDSLPAHWRYGPLRVFDKPQVRPWLKPGNVIAGTIAVHCANCARGHTYWVLITWGEGGWFSEIKDITSGNLIAPGALEGKTPRGYELKITVLGKVSEADQKDRIPIEPLKPEPGTRTQLPGPDAQPAQ